MVKGTEAALTSDSLLALLSLQDEHYWTCSDENIRTLKTELISSTCQEKLLYPYSGWKLITAALLNIYARSLPIFSYMQLV